MPWVKLRRVKNIRIRGSLKTYHAGDSVEVGKQTALQWVLDGTAEDPFGQVGPPLRTEDIQKRGSEYGLRIRGDKSSAIIAALSKILRQVSYGPPALPYKYTLIWRPDKGTDERIVRYGFMRVMEGAKGVDAWELAASLVSTSMLAEAVGTFEEQQKTLKVVGDLRLPVYESRLVWARKTPAALKVVEAWAAELRAGGDEHHSFLRALFKNSALLCTIPGDWRG